MAREVQFSASWLGANVQSTFDDLIPVYRVTSRRSDGPRGSLVSMSPSGSITDTEKDDENSERIDAGLH
jgi:hypothetical protein